MYDVQKAVRGAYIARLKNQITVTVNGSPLTVPVLDRIPKGQPFPYIHIAQQTQAGRSFKYPSGHTCKFLESTILLNVFTGFMGNAGGKELADTISEKIIELISPESKITPLTVPVAYQNLFSIFEIELEDTFGSEAITETETEYSIRRSIRFRNYLQQN